MIFNNNLYDSSYTTIEAIQKRYEELKQLSGVDEYKKFYEEYNVEEVIIIPGEQTINSIYKNAYKIYDYVSSVQNGRLPDSCREDIERVTQSLSDYSYDIGLSLKDYGAKIIDETPEFSYWGSSIFMTIESTTILTDLYNGTYDIKKQIKEQIRTIKALPKVLIMA